MIDDNSKKEVVRYWMEKADEAIASAMSEQSAGRYGFALNRAYYACFYAASALLFKNNKKFTKHSGVRSALHQYVVKTGVMSEKFGKIYDRLFESRQEGDYLELVEFEKDQVEAAISDAVAFVLEIKKC